MMEHDPAELWTSYYAKARRDGVDLAWPSETLVRLMKGSYIPGLDRCYEGKRVLEVGFGSGNNLVFLASLGLEVHAVEVTRQVCALAQERLGRLGITADLRVGTNRHLPYPDSYFDVLVSWNVIHYEDTSRKIEAAIREYARVLKPGGRFFLSTTGPEDMILAEAETVDCHRYRIGRSDDFRKGQVFFYFDAPNCVKRFFQQAFHEVLVGRTRDHLMTQTLDFFVVTGVKP
ncbi:MAG: class I SAM-dependent methyltransferase [Chthonomonadales bacterium]